MMVHVVLVGHLARKGASPRDVPLPEGARLKDLLAGLALPPGQEVMAVVDDGPAGSDTPLRDGAQVRVIAVVDGG